MDAILAEKDHDPAHEVFPCNYFPLKSFTGNSFESMFITYDDLDHG